MFSKHQIWSVGLRDTRGWMTSEGEAISKSYENSQNAEKLPRKVPLQCNSAIFLPLKTLTL